MQEDVSPLVVTRRIRNRRIEYFELASDFPAQLEYQRIAPVHVPNEVINQWQDTVYGDVATEVFDQRVYSPEEVDAVRKFHIIWDAVADELPQQLPSIEEVQRLSAWQILRDAAAQALAVFMKRGRLPEW